LHKNYWKRGYATEGARAVLEFAFNILKLDEIVSFTSKLNLPSIAVMERLGMERDLDGDFNHPAVDEESPLRSHVLYRIRKQKSESVV
jgi:ribosomal-protein-alanine N-acetyltransferase